MKRSGHRGSITCLGKSIKSTREQRMHAPRNLPGLEEPSQERQPSQNAAEPTDNLILEYSDCHCSQDMVEELPETEQRNSTSPEQMVPCTSNRRNLSNPYDHWVAYRSLSCIRREGEYRFVGEICIPVLQCVAQTVDIANDIMTWHVYSEVIQEEIRYLLAQDTDATVYVVSEMSRGSTENVEREGPHHLRVTYDFEIINPDDQCHRGLSQRQLDMLSTKTFQENGSLTTCTVCLATFIEGDILRSLPCSHEFHVDCVDQWLSMHSACPICRGMVMPSLKI